MRAAGGFTSADARIAATSDVAILRHPSTPATTRHPIVQSFEPGEDWFWDYRTEEYADGPVMAPPQYHPLDQPVPGAAGRVPRDWQDHLH